MYDVSGPGNLERDRYSMATSLNISTFLAADDYESKVSRNNGDNCSNEQTDSVLPISNPYVAAYLIVIVLLAIVSNVVVIVVMSLRKRKTRMFQLCLASVCMSDLLFSILLHPMSIASALGYDAKRIFNHSGCLYFGTFALFFGTYDMVIHCVIAMLRYINLCYPSRKWISKYSMISLLTACILYSLMWCIGPSLGVGKYQTFEVGCTIAFSDQTLGGRTFVSCAFVFVFFLPLAVTVSSYIAIIIEAGRQRRVLEKLGNVVTSKPNKLEIELKLIRLTSIIAAAYVIAWLPYTVVCFWEAYGNAATLEPLYRTISALFCKTSTATNPIIYLFLSKGFRHETTQTLHTLLRWKKGSLFSSIQYSSSPKSSSCRTQSDIPLQSPWGSKFKKEHSMKKMHILSSESKSTNLESFV